MSWLMYKWIIFKFKRGRCTNTIWCMRKMDSSLTFGYEYMCHECYKTYSTFEDE